MKLAVADGVFLWPGYFDSAAQTVLLAEVLKHVDDSPFYKPVMPKTGAPFSVEETNFGPLGWVSDISGYRYEDKHPDTKRAWPAIPQTLLDLWRAISGYEHDPQCCLVNFYRAGARMGLHQDREEATDAPVVSVSLGDEALFRIGGPTRKGPTRSVKLRSGDVLLFGGPARMAYHGLDRIVAGSSGLVPGGGRINLTLRRVTRPSA
ncbi:MAG TPA: alpha-ketoglutarate-dependent dioxygenase AlkB [Rhizomicrobium sp.]|nr:alpha-ketoglutarate-dependent dioxygenase AlkB [Rhizomicrobium sp.]